MLKFTASTLKKIEKLLDEAGYTVRYERGNFKSGYCVLESKKVIVINKYFPVDARVSSMVDILAELPIDTKLISMESFRLLEKIQQKEIEF